MRGAERRVARWAGAAVLGLGLLGLLLGEPALRVLWRASRGSDSALCSYRERTGRPCIGCGGTHAFARAARGDLAGAAAENALGAWAALVLGVTGLGALGSLVSGRARPLLWTGAGALASAPLAFAWSVVAWLARSG